MYSTNGLNLGREHWFANTGGLYMHIDCDCLNYDHRKISRKKTDKAQVYEFYHSWQFANVHWSRCLTLLQWPNLTENE